MSKLVTIYGGSGFVGRYITRRLAKQGWRIRVAVRNVNEAMFVRPYGVVGQVEPVFCNVRDDASVRAAMQGADAVVYSVGVLDEVGKNTFAAVQAEGPGRVGRIAAGLGIGRMVLISAIGASETSPSAYARTKAAGEAAVLEHMPGAMILRPSIVFGPEDQFFNRFAGMTRMGPVLPVVGPETKFQPVYVDDVAQAAVMGVEGQARGIFELGGPDVDSFRGWMHTMLKVIHRRRLVVGLPFWLARVMAGVFGLVKRATFGIVRPPITTDQVRNLALENVVAADARGFADLGIRPAAVASVLPEYLWRFRPSGQYDAIKDSAKNLRKT